MEKKSHDEAQSPLPQENSSESPLITDHVVQEVLPIDSAEEPSPASETPPADISGTEDDPGEKILT